MKKLNALMTTLCLVLFVTFLGCNNTSSQINEIVKLLNSQLPISMGMMGEITQVSISDNFMEMVCNVDEDIINLQALKDSPELIRENLVQLITNGNVDGMNFVLDELKDANMGLKLTYIGKTSQTQVSASLSANEIKQLLAQPIQAKNPKELLDSQINITNLQLPMEVGNNMTLDSLIREEDYIMYYYSWTDEMVEFLGANQDEMKAEIVQMLKNDDPDMALIKNMYKDAGIGMAFCYIGREKNNKVTIRINLSEL